MRTVRTAAVRPIHAPLSAQHLRLTPRSSASSLARRSAPTSSTAGCGLSMPSCWRSFRLAGSLCEKAGRIGRPCCTSCWGLRPIRRPHARASAAEPAQKQRGLIERKHIVLQGRPRAAARNLGVSAAHAASAAVTMRWPHARVSALQACHGEQCSQMHTSSCDGHAAAGVGQNPTLSRPTAPDLSSLNQANYILCDLPS